MSIGTRKHTNQFLSIPRDVVQGLLRVSAERSRAGSLSLHDLSYTYLQL